MTTPRKRSFDVALLATQIADNLKASKRQNCTVSDDIKSHKLKDSAPLALDQHQNSGRSIYSVATTHSGLEPAEPQTTAEQPKPKPRTFTLHFSASATTPTITLTIPPIDGNIEIIQEDNDTPTQDWKHGNALVVPSCDWTRHITYINPLKEQPATDDYEKTIVAEEDVGSEVDLDDYDFWDYEHDSRPSSPVPPETPLNSDHPFYVDFPSLSNDTEYMSEPGHVSTYTFIACNGIDEGDDDDDSSDIQDFFNDAAAA